MKDIKGYEGLYAITSCGKVWSYRKQKFLRGYDNKHGYLYVNLYKDGKGVHRKIHRLVAEAYLDNPEGKPQVDHIDGCRTHNWLSNLRWTTGKENIGYTSFAGKPKCFSKVRCVETGEIFKSCADAARAVGVHRYSINCVLLGKTKTSGGYHWERVLKNETEISENNQ